MPLAIDELGALQGLASGQATPAGLLVARVRGARPTGIPAAVTVVMCAVVAAALVDGLGVDDEPAAATAGAPAGVGETDAVKAELQRALEERVGGREREARAASA